MWLLRWKGLEWLSKETEPIRVDDRASPTLWTKHQASPPSKRRREIPARSTPDSLHHGIMASFAAQGMARTRSKERGNTVLLDPVSRCESRTGSLNVHHTAIRCRGPRRSCVRE